MRTSRPVAERMRPRAGEARGVRRSGPAGAAAAGSDARAATGAASAARHPLARRLCAAIVALALAFGTCLAAHAEGGGRLAGMGDGAGTARAGSTGGSVLGILLDSTPPSGGGDLVANGSYLGVLLATAASEDVTVTFLLERAAEGAEPRVYHTETIGMGTPVPRPPDPVWPKAEGDADDFVFDVWCTEDGAAYDFATPVTANMTLHAAWVKKDPDQRKVAVTFKGCGGEMADPDDASQTVGECTVEVLAGAHYPFPADPVRTGYVFQGWFTAEEGGERVTGADVVGEADETLYAQWKAVTYRVCYHENHGSAPLSWTDPAPVTYDATDVTFADWDRVRAEGHFTKPDGKDLDGWCATKDGSGAKYRPGDPVANLADVDGKVVDLYAVWKKAGTVEEGPFGVTFHFNDGTGRTHVVEDVEKFGTVPEEAPVAAPKRTGYQFAGWFADEGLTEPWTFATQVTGDLELWGAWTLRLDVTVPVSVAFAVDAATGEAAGPGADRYALKSRTVAPVEVESLALESRQGELEGFFALAEGEAGASAPGWEAALAGTELSLAPAGADAIGLPFAGERAGDVWSTLRELGADESASWRMDAFDYGVLAADDAWQGGDPSEQLPLALALSISDDLEVLTGQEGPVPIARLKVTVSVKA